VSRLNHNMKGADEAADMVKAIARLIRFRIIAIVCRGNERVNDLLERFGTSQATVSHHLHILRISNKVASIRKRRETRYTVIQRRIRERIQCPEIRCSSGAVGRLDYLDADNRKARTLFAAAKKTREGE
jgi:DNA-binding transcriptional ArsR family regulator